MVSEDNRERMIEHLGYLIWIRLTAMVLSVLSMWPVLGSYLREADILPELALIVVLWLLGEGKGRYGKASVLLAVSMGITFVVRLVGGLTGGSMITILSLIVTLAASACSFVAVYQEYNAHAELIEPWETTVAQKWHSLFNWQIVVLLGAFVMNFLNIVIFIEFPALGGVYLVVLRLVNLLISWCYARNLGAMRKVLLEQT